MPEIRTHLKHIFGRDIGQFRLAQGATTKTYFTYSEEERRRDQAKLAISRKGCGDFLVPLRCGFVAVATATASSPRLADTRKSLATRQEGMFEMGSDAPELYLRFFTAALLAVVALALQFKSVRLMGIEADFALVAFVALGFFLPFREFLVLLLGSGIALNWQPIFGWELFVFLFIPPMFFFLKRISPWQPWLTNAAAVFLAVIFFYTILDNRIFVAHLPLFGMMLAADILFGMLTFELLRHFYPPTIHIRM